MKAFEAEAEPFQASRWRSLLSEGHRRLWGRLRFLLTSRCLLSGLDSIGANECREARVEGSGCNRLNGSDQGGLSLSILYASEWRESSSFKKVQPEIPLPAAQCESSSTRARGHGPPPACIFTVHISQRNCKRLRRRARAVHITRHKIRGCPRASSVPAPMRQTASVSQSKGAVRHRVEAGFSGLLTSYAWHLLTKVVSTMTSHLERLSRRRPRFEGRFTTSRPSGSLSRAGSPDRISTRCWRQTILLYCSSSS